MLFHIQAMDKPGALELRLKTREAHLAYLDSSSITVHVAGPLLDDANKPIGSILIIDADDQNTAEQWAALDPYARAGLFENVTVTPWKWVIGAPEGVE